LDISTQLSIQNLITFVLKLRRNSSKVGFTFLFLYIYDDNCVVTMRKNLLHYFSLLWVSATKSKITCFLCCRYWRCDLCSRWLHWLKFGKGLVP